MCMGHAYEALDHGAHLSFGAWDGRDQRLESEQALTPELADFLRQRIEEVATRKTSSTKEQT
jgi:hypothetical protein